jgi:hypothetical protein
MRQAMKGRRDIDIEKGRTSCGFNSVTGPAVTQLQTWVANSLQTGDLGVLEGGCERDHARHVPAEVGEVVICQAGGKWRQMHIKRFQECGCHTCWRDGVPMDALWQIYRLLSWERTCTI